MHNGLRSYSLHERVGREASLSRVQGKHSHLPPRERLAQQRQAINNAAGRNAMEPHTVPNTPPLSELADDILRGADAIAEFLFGDRASRRKVYYLAESTKLPIFRLGSVLCARRSVLLAFITSQERRALPNADTLNIRKD
jgi:hypothetical protein